ncbi:hypothetical protein N7466_003649 [Penicillium verhagenii]|uniref:uncharacterized protein n=1 Tax=Penicillium verhagenii TaxID=1562060 RepID=UPI002545520C|nr:uncharacterized protein N7466_003649 [Penicillium verhagenii]KAJ5934102.1 hypothetical protein N7466_003649 [Penicillium verhagenii]
MVSLQAPHDTTANIEVADIYPLADSLYQSTRESPSLVNQATNELDLLLTVLDFTRSYAALCTKTLPVQFPEILRRCRGVLVDLRTFSLYPSRVGSHHQIMEIRSRLGSITFELSMMNANMAIASQKNVSMATRRLIDDIQTGKRDPLIVSNVLDVGQCSSEISKNEAWQRLQTELIEIGIGPEISNQDHEFIISTLDRAVKDEDLLRSMRPEPHIEVNNASHPPVNHSHSPLNDPPSKQNMIETDTDKIALPRNSSDLPILTATEIQGDSDKEVLPRENFPEPVLSARWSPGDDADKEVFQENFPIAIETELGSSTTFSGTQSDASSSRGESSSYTAIVRGKKPNIMRKMKFKLMNSSDRFFELVRQGDLNTVQRTLDKGAHVNTMDLHGQTALMYAIQFSHMHLVDLLLAYDANAVHMSAKGDTALSIAAARGSEKLVRMLLERGTLVDGSKNIGKTALSQAAECGHENVVRMLFNAGADINGLSHTGDTALSKAAMNGHLDIVRFLLDNGAIPDHCGYPRKTPLYKAVHNGELEVVKVLLQRGADQSCPDSNRGWTPLTLAAMYNRTEMLAMMNGRGAGFTPYQHQNR